MSLAGVDLDISCQQGSNRSGTQPAHLESAARTNCNPHLKYHQANESSPLQPQSPGWARVCSSFGLTNPTGGRDWQLCTRCARENSRWNCPAKGGQHITTKNHVHTACTHATHTHTLLGVDSLSPLPEDRTARNQKSREIQIYTLT